MVSSRCWRFRRQVSQGAWTWQHQYFGLTRRSSSAFDRLDQSGFVLKELHTRLREHREPTIKKETILQWLDDLEKLQYSHSESAAVDRAAREEQLPASPGPFMRSSLVGIAVGTTSPLFILLPWSVAFVPIGALYGMKGVHVTVELVLPLLLNTPIALANFVGGFLFAFARELFVLRGGANWHSSKVIHRHGVLVGLATGMTTPFLSCMIAQQLVTFGLIEPLALAMSCAWEVVPAQFIAACLLVTVPMGAGGGAIIAMAIAPHLSSRRSIPFMAFGLLGVWVTTTALWGLPISVGEAKAIQEEIKQEFTKGSNNKSKKLDAFVEDPQTAKKWKQFIDDYSSRLNRAKAIFGFG